MTKKANRIHYSIVNLFLLLLIVKFFVNRVLLFVIKKKWKKAKKKYKISCYVYKGSKEKHLTMCFQFGCRFYENDHTKEKKYSNIIKIDFQFAFSKQNKEEEKTTTTNQI